MSSFSVAMETVSCPQWKSEFPLGKARTTLASVRFVTNRRIDFPWLTPSNTSETLPAFKPSSSVGLSGQETGEDGNQNE